MDIIKLGINKTIPQTKAPQFIIDCQCGCMYNINLNTESIKKFWDKGRKLFVWQMECPNCHETTNIGIKCKSKDKALAYFFLRGNKWI